MHWGIATSTNAATAPSISVVGGGGNFFGAFQWVLGYSGTPTWAVKASGGWSSGATADLMPALSATGAVDGSQSYLGIAVDRAFATFNNASSAPSIGWVEVSGTATGTAAQSGDHVNLGNGSITPHPLVSGTTAQSIAMLISANG